MRFQLLPQSLLLLSASLLGSAGVLHKRDPGNSYEILYLTDCENNPKDNLTSQITYYLDWKDSFKGQHPIGWAQLPSRVRWENETNTGALRADKGDYQTVAINPYAGDLGNRAFAGIMNTSYGVYLPCFKDAGQLVYTNDPAEKGAEPSKCYSKYFCIDAATFSQFESCYMPAYNALAPFVPRPVDFFF